MKYNNSILKAAAILVMLFTTVWVDAAVWKIDSGLLNKAGLKDTINLMIDQNDVQFASFQVDLTFPEGLSPVGDPSMPETMFDGHTVDWQDLGGNAFRCVAYNNNNNLVKGTNGVLLSIPVQISEDFIAGSIVASKGLIAKKNSENYEIAEYSCEVMVSKEIVVTVSGQLQTITPGKAAELTIETVEPAELKDLLTVSYFKDEACATPATEADRQTEGTIYAKVSFSGKDEYLPYTAVYPMELKAKKIIQVEVSGLEQYADSQKAAELTIVSTEPSTAKDSITISYYKDKACATPATEADRMKEGIIYAKVSYPGNTTYEEYNEVYRMVLKSKQNIKVVISGLTQNVNTEKAAELTITSVEPESFRNSMIVVYYKDKACNEVADETTRKSKGTYYVKVSCPGDTEYLPFDSVYTMVVKGKEVVVNVSDLEQTVNSEKAATVGVTTIPEDKFEPEIYYKNEDCTEVATEADRKNVGQFYVKVSYPGDAEYEAYVKVYTLIVNSKKDILVEKITLPECDALKEGELLSKSVLKGGYVVDEDNKPIPGSFEWSDGNQRVTSSGKYSVTFYPNSHTYYNEKKFNIDVTVNKAYRVWTETPKNGYIKFSGNSADSTYIENQELVLEAIPDENYQFKNWIKNGVAITGESELIIKVNEKAGYSAEFVEILRTVNIITEGSGVLSVNDENGPVQNGNELHQGSILEVTATPNSGYQLKSLTVNDDSLKGKNLKLAADVTLKAVFEQKPIDKYSVNLEVAKGKGSILAYKIDGTPIISGSTVDNGTRIYFNTLSAAGFEIDGDINVLGATQQGNYYIINNNMTATASFKAKQYNLKVESKNSKGEVVDGAKITISKIGGGETGIVEYGDFVKVEAAEFDNGKLSYILANGVRVDLNDQIKVTGPLAITAVFEERAEILEEYIMWPHQSFYYNGTSRNFVPFASQTYAGFDFNVKYKRVLDGNGDPDNEDELLDNAKDAGTYTVVLHREADDLYNKFDAEYKEGLIIKKSTIAVTKAPVGNNDPETNPKENVTIVKSNESDNWTKYDIIPNDKISNNFNGTVYYHEKSEAAKTEISFGVPTLRNTEVTQQGYVKITNGGLPYDGDGEIVSVTTGMTVTIEAIPGNDYKFKEWSDGSKDNPRVDYEVKGESLSLIPKFEKKEDPIITLKESESEYDGGDKTVTIAQEDFRDANITFFMDKDCKQSATLKNAGKYYVKVYRPADENYSSFEEIFEYTITRKTISSGSIVPPEASDVLAGETLSQSVLMGGNAGIVPGTFTWVNPNTKLTEESGEYEVMFTPSDPNYNKVTFKVKVNAIGGTKSEGETDPENPTDPTDPSEPTDPEEPTSLEDIEARTIITSHNQIINVIPAVPMNLTVINMTGNMIYNGLISTEGKIDVRTPGVYILKMNFGENTLVKKINVR